MIYYTICNHWTESGIGLAFTKGWFKGQWYSQCFSSVYTIEKMLDAADEFEGLKVSMELDSYTYEKLVSVAPKTIERLKKYIREGKATVVGGTYGQPLGQDYGGESNIAQLVYGRETIKKILDYDCCTFLVEEQWFHPQLPQLLKKSGFNYASLQCQNSGQVKPMDQPLFVWEGIDHTGILSIPSNRNMVSCVKQYGDYSYLWNHLEKQQDPLLFQWVEVWVPGMDWGASVTPFTKAIEDVKQHNAIFTDLQSYFETVQEQSYEKKYISLDESHYANDWYQDGGWGYDGDQIIYREKECENWIQAYETVRFLKQNNEDQRRDDFWKRLLILQNHDVSVARGYRAISEDDIVTDANSLFLRDLKKLLQDLKKECILPKDKINLFSYNGASGIKDFEFDIEENDVHVYHNGVRLPSSIQMGKLHVAIPIQSYQTTQIELKKEKPHMEQTSLETSISYQNIKLLYKGGWCIQIENEIDHLTIDYKAFSGSISKRNEHDDHFHALSSAHYQFSFAFDGMKHCQDQCSEQYVTYEGIKEDDLYITMTLSCNLLTLHTTDTPVAFSKSRVRLNKITKELNFDAYLYCGVYLNMDAYTTFTYQMENDEVYRNYPFGEEETKLSAFYALDYVRIQNQNSGFTIMNYGNQRVTKENHQLCFKISKGKMLNNYHFHYSLCFDTKDALDSYKYMLKEKLLPIHSDKKINMKIDQKEIVYSSFYRKDKKDYFRFLNLSDKKVSSRLHLHKQYQLLNECDFYGNNMRKLNQESNIVNLEFEPMEIKTMVCADE